MKNFEQLQFDMLPYFLVLLMDLIRESAGQFLQSKFFCERQADEVSKVSNFKHPKF